ncbi:helix-turn-helix domain-containing protein [Solihabitans fulvus]|uniref:Helix-turn-helix domain-containing protein n=1 Tax=Solihabitans fulvus TaxID=1892852 RepID=A0A5B2WRE6_9PSEU|nr:helix-turn-helix transcriptional regulator [Solihabitans fulvus]KAA2253564.1 helix-turn-helix domain-containing protein [Solihabitans fulvus]
MSVQPDPALINTQLGIELRRLREEAGITSGDAADRVGCKQPKMSKIENGHQGITPDEIRALGELYEASPEQIDYLVELTLQRPKRRRRASTGDAVPDWFRRFLAVEWDASEARIYEVESVTGLLQTEEYARSMMLTWEPEADERLIDKQVATRMNRQAVLKRTGRPSLRLEVVLSEAALHRVQGSPKIMRAQLQHLIKMSKRPNITLRVLPFDAVDRVTVPAGFMLFRLSQQKLSMVYLEDALGATYLKEPEEFTAYGSVFARLRTSTLDPDATRELMDKLASAYK